MTVKVRLFTHEGLVSAVVSSYSGQAASNGVWFARMPYLANETLTVDTGAAVKSSPALSENGYSNLLRLEVEAGKRVRFEISTKNGGQRTATQDSPVLYGEQTLVFGQGYSVSLIEDADA